MTLRAILLTVLSAFLLAAPAASQATGHTPGSWKQVETEHFLFLYPKEMEEWALDMARRMEAVHQAVTGLIGHVPEERVTVLVDDPGNVSNGSMSPGPLLYMWPTPPDPRSMIGENRGWGEILAVHELAHAVHLTRPTRNPFQGFLWRLAPIPVQPMMLGTPRWLTEGYATYVEGALTGSGRPHGVWRPAILRTWALEGQIPTYGAVSGTGGYLGGAMAYLVGSAYVEWLVEREGRGPAVLPDLWARMTARQVRDFSQAFQGVLGHPPDELYGLFTVDVTERALRVRHAVEEVGGPVEGQLFQRLRWSTGDPAVSPDGERIALALASGDEPPRIVVMASTPDTVPTKERERLEEILEKDPQDVAAVRRIPRAQKPEATLQPDFGRPYRNPRWLPDGQGILVVRDVTVENGRLRPELFVWEWETGKVRAVTRGQAVREADPAPDGTWAAGTRCLAGRCDVVRVDLASGAVTTLAHSDIHTPYSRPRVSPNGSTIVAGRQLDGLWRLVAMDADGSNERVLGPDDGAARLDAEFLSDGTSLVLTSTRGGIPNLELLDLGSGEVKALTRVLRAAVAPAPVPIALAAPEAAPSPFPSGSGVLHGPAPAPFDDARDTHSPPAGDAPFGGTPLADPPNGEIFFLSLHSRGWDLRRISLADAAVTPASIPLELSPAAPVGIQDAPPFPPAPLDPPRGYGTGPRFWSYWPLVSLAREGYAAGLALHGTDPIGRVTWQLRGMYGSRDAWRGGALDLLWRGSRPWIQAQGFLADGPLPRSPETPAPGGYRSLTKGYYGGLASLSLQRNRDRGSASLRLGGSAGTLEGEGRTLGFGSLELTARQTPGKIQMRQSLSLSASTGRTAGEDWTRWLASGTLGVGSGGTGLLVSGTMGGTGGAAGAIGSPEAFQVGGTESLLLDPAILSQRVAMPALGPGFLRGTRVRTASAELRSQVLGRLFFWAGDVGGEQAGWFRVAGAETAETAPAMPFIRLPSATFRFGSAYLLDEPYRGAWRWWVVLGWRP
jgi:hypothetical protein